MKRKGYIIEEIIKRDNIEDSFDYVIRTKCKKNLKSKRN